MSTDAQIRLVLWRWCPFVHCETQLNKGSSKQVIQISLVILINIHAHFGDGCTAWNMMCRPHRMQIVLSKQVIHIIEWIFMSNNGFGKQILAPCIIKFDNCEACKFHLSFFYSDVSIVGGYQVISSDMPLSGT